MDSQKAPGLDGYNLLFFKKAWKVIVKEVVAAVQQFHHTSFLPKTLNTTLLTLLPKTQNACRAKEFRHIACCLVLYKIISKVIANRLQMVLNDIISASQ